MARGIEKYKKITGAREIPVEPREITKMMPESVLCRKVWLWLRASTRTIHQEEDLLHTHFKTQQIPQHFLVTFLVIDTPRRLSLLFYMNVATIKYTKYKIKDNHE